MGIGQRDPLRDQGVMIDHGWSVFAKDATKGHKKVNKEVSKIMVTSAVVGFLGPLIGFVALSL